MTGRTLQAAIDFPMEVGHGDDDRRFRREQRTKRAMKRAALPDVTEACCLVCSRWMAPGREGERFGACLALVVVKDWRGSRVDTVEAAWKAKGEISRLQTAPGFRACDSFVGRDGSRPILGIAGASAASTAGTGEDGTPARAATGLHGLAMAVRNSARASAPAAASAGAGDE